MRVSCFVGSHVGGGRDEPEGSVRHKDGAAQLPTD